ncbi:MAG: nitrous oxide reductase family maturation protein NosD [Candidatus Thorarchaeota archaeon]
MKSKAVSKISLILIIIGILFVFSSVISKSLKLNSGISEKSAEYGDSINLDKEDVKFCAVSEKIHIDNNWTATKAAGICTGNGTYSDPYVIEDLVIDGKGFGSCILIENSNVFFKIENCTLFNSTGYHDAGILLNCTDNGLYIDNDCSSNHYGIRLINCNNNLIANNSLDNNISGILYQNGYNNTISGNSINFNSQDGIYISIGSYNNISGNTVSYNDNRGIILIFDICHNNIITENIIKKNGYEGLYILDGYENKIHLNCFIHNSINARDGGSNNAWDNGTIGNYWSNYTGSDENGDEVGDIPYNISGSAGSQDNFPLIKCPFSAQDGGGIPIELIILISVISGGALIGIATLLLISFKFVKKK